MQQIAESVRCYSRDKLMCCVNYTGHLVPRRSSWSNLGFMGETFPPLDIHCQLIRREWCSMSENGAEYGNGQLSKIIAPLGPAHQGWKQMHDE